MNHFVIVFDRSTGAILEILEFPDSRRGDALKTRFARELEYRSRPEIEVVSLGAASLADLKRTHTRYFGDELRRAVG